MIAAAAVAMMGAMLAAMLGAMLGGCVEGFRGSNVQLDLFPGTPSQAPIGAVPGMFEIPANSHFTLHAIREDGTQSRTSELVQFEIHRIVDLTSPCFIDVGDRVPHPGLHVTAYATRIAQDTGITDPANPPPTATAEQRTQMETALLRMNNVMALGSALGIKAVTSASTAVYPAVAADCAGPADQIPPAMCIDDASNQRRLQLCQDTWRANPTMWEGTDRVLTAPLAGTTHGMMVGRNPINMAPVGGAQFFVPEALGDADAYAITFEIEGAPVPPTQLYFGRPTMPTRGVSRIHFTSPLNPMLFSEMAVFADLGRDDVQF
jgi:hypothetical protein